MLVLVLRTLIIPSSARPNGITPRMSRGFNASGSHPFRQPRVTSNGVRSVAGPATGRGSAARGPASDTIPRPSTAQMRASAGGFVWSEITVHIADSRSSALHRSSRTNETLDATVVRAAVAASRSSNARVPDGSLACMAASSSAVGRYRSTLTLTGRNSIVRFEASTSPLTFGKHVSRNVARPSSAVWTPSDPANEHCGRGVSNVVVDGVASVVPSSAFSPVRVTVKAVASGSTASGSNSSVRVDAHRNDPSTAGVILTNGEGSSCRSMSPSAATGRSNSQRRTVRSAVRRRPVGVANTTRSDASAFGAWSLA